MNFVKGAQFYEDLWIIQNEMAPKQGVFVEVGAEGGIQLSNTILFEEYLGWRGLLIEANPEVIEELRHNRPLAKVHHCAIGTDPTQDFYICDNSRSCGALGRPVIGGRPVKVPVQRLDTVLDTYGIQKIDLLSLDTEGSELEVWNTMDHNKYKPGVVVIEWNTCHLPSNEDTILKVFAELPYTFVHKTEANLIFVRNPEC